MSGALNGDTESVNYSNVSSSLNTFSPDIRSTLDEFRVNWQRKLHVSVITSEPNAPDIDNANDETKDVLNHLPDDPENLQTRAEQLFRKGVELEQHGKVYDALPYYRKAVQIVPDIELKYYERQKLSANSAESTSQNPIIGTIEEKSNEHVDIEVDNIDMCEKFRFDLNSECYGGKLLLSNRDANIISTELHLSDLPPEILMYIFRWVVSNQLDMNSLEQCAGVCKGMYLCARDDEIWRLACKRIWGHNVGTLVTSDEKPINTDAPLYCSWREMFMQRERVLFSGCYISKTTYLRMGENSFQDQYYRPVQLVEYYRYIRFLPDGKALMMTNADEPAQGVSKLKQLHNLRPDIMRGYYRLCDNMVILMLHRQRQSFVARQRRGSVFSLGTSDDTDNTQYIIKFQILNTPKRKFAQLAWRNYTLIQTRNKTEITSEFDVIPAKYPPLWFSTVRSYNLDADAPLN